MGRMVMTADGGEREEVTGPTVYRNALGEWKAIIPETTLRNMVEQPGGWGAQAFYGAAKEALDRHDADKRREEWVERHIGALADGLGLGSTETVNGWRDWLRAAYGRAVGTEER